MIDKIKHKLYIFLTWNIPRFILNYSPIYIHFSDIFKEYNRCNDIFLKPKYKWNFNYITFKDNKFKRIQQCGWQHKHPFYRILYVYEFNLGWKYKWDYISYERNPRFVVSLFGSLFTLELELTAPINNKRNCPDDDLYWEAMLNYLYLYDADIKKTKENWGWKERVGEDTTGESFYESTWNNQILTENGKNLI